MEEQEKPLFTIEDYRVYWRYIKALQRHAGYCRRVRQYIRMNRALLHSSGWLDWAIQEANRQFVPETKLPLWSEEQVAAMRSEFDRKQGSK